jgi:hypothetical protein
LGLHGCDRLSLARVYMVVMVLDAKQSVYTGKLHCVVR